MGTNNYAYGVSNSPDVPWVGFGAGIKSDQGLIFPATSRVAAYVRSTGPSNLDPPEISMSVVRTLAAGLKQCRSGFNDIVVVLPGHAENVTDATMLDNLVPGTRIVGWGCPLQDDAPTFTFTAAASQWVVNDKNVCIRGLKLKASMTTPFVTKAIAVTAAGCSILDCVIETSTASNAGALVMIGLGAGAHQFLFSGNYVYGTIGTFQTGVITGEAAINDLQIVKNVIMAPATIATGVIAIGAFASLRVLIQDNVLSNSTTARAHRRASSCTQRA